MSENGFDVVDPVDIGDLSDQTGAQVIDAARKINFEVAKASLQEVKDKKTSELIMKKINVQAKIGPLGVDGSGRYAGKIIFAELICWFDPNRYTSDWWKKQARFPLKAYLQATSQEITGIKVDDEWLESQKGRGFIADILKKPIQVKVDGEYQDSGDYKNELANYKKAE